MSGRIIRLGKDGCSPHECSPPTFYWPRSDAIEPQGTVWQCECGRQWIVNYENKWRHKWFKVRTSTGDGSES